MELNVDPAKCIRCGLCLRECAPGCLVFAADLHPKFGKDAESRCNHCQHCLAVCPTGALSIFGKDPEQSPKCGELPTPEAMLSLIRSRRSIRFYRKENVEPEVMAQLLAMLAWVPTGVNDHRLHFAVVDDLAVMDELRTLVNDKIQAMLSEDPVPAAAQRMIRYRGQILAGKDVIFRGAPHMIVACTSIEAPCADYDPTIALSYFELYAKSLGLGTVWCGLAAGALQIVPEFLERMQIPAGYRVGYAMLFGPTDRQFVRATQPEPVSVHRVK